MRVMSLLMVSLGLLACGKTGDLYLPEKSVSEIVPQHIVAELFDPAQAMQGQVNNAVERFEN